MHRNFDFATIERFRHYLNQSVGEPLECGSALHACKQAGKLVAADAADQVFRMNESRQSVSEQAQQFVSRIVTMRIIYRFETVQIKVQNSKRLHNRASLAECMIQPPAKEAAVG